jgi:hypothetical protein
MSFGKTVSPRGNAGYYEEELFEAGKSPFKPPNDEEVFVTRETEKAKKKDAKEALKH